MHHFSRPTTVVKHRQALIVPGRVTIEYFDHVKLAFRVIIRKAGFLRLEIERRVKNTFLVKEVVLYPFYGYIT